MLKTADVEALLVPVVIQILGSESVNKVEVYSVAASDDVDIIQMNVWVNGDVSTYDPKKALQVLSAVNHTLSEAGDDRFVSMLPVFAGDEPGENDGPIPDEAQNEH